MAKPAGNAPEMDAYQRWLADQESAKLAKLADKADAKTFQLAEPFSDKATGASKDFQLQLDPTVDPTTNIDNMNYQLQAPEMIQGMGPTSTPVQGIGGDAGAGAAGASAGSMAAAGIGAAGQAVSIIAQLAGAKAAKDAMLASNAANRDMSEKLARMSLTQNAGQFDTAEKMNAYGALMQALNGASDQTMRQRALNRSNSQNMGNALTTAFLGA